jgi:pentapeptide MXKDX repeat protein
MMNKQIHQKTKLSKFLPHLKFYLRLSILCFLIGAGLEFLMIKGGYYDHIIQGKAKKLARQQLQKEQFQKEQFQKEQFQKEQLQKDQIQKEQQQKDQIQKEGMQKRDTKI